MEDGYIQLGDFGLCREDNGDALREFIGTVSYMAPEIIA